MEGRTASEELAAHTTQEVVSKLIVWTEIEHACPEEPPSPRINVQEPSVPSGEDILEKNLNEMVSSKEASLK